ncbi:MAG: Arc family DNA-binding protein [Planctomycetes bacterium]|nr:Arc family DNA-binding protein [Planctomycetota bacterium]
MAKRDSFLLRIPPELLEALRRWADDEFRSVNSQIEMILARAVAQSGRSSKSEDKSDETEAPKGKKKPQRGG